MRTAFLNNDTRREPKTRRFCIKCQRDIKPGQPARRVHLIWDGGPMVVHLEDEAGFVLPEGAEDHGFCLIGMDCAKQVGIEFTAPEEPAVPTEER